MKKMTLSNSLSRAFLTRFKTLLVLIGLMLILTADFAVEVNCDRKLKREKSADSRFKSLEVSNEVNDDHSDYYYEDTDIKIIKTIPAVKPTSTGGAAAVSLSSPVNPTAIRVSEMRKSIQNRIDNNRDLVVRIVKKAMNNSASQPEPPLPESLKNSLDGNRLDGDSDMGGVAEARRQNMDPKEMKSIADEVADAILAEADKLYATLSPEESNKDSGMSSFSSQSNLESSNSGFSQVDDSNYAICPSSE